MTEPQRDGGLELVDSMSDEDFADILGPGGSESRKGPDILTDQGFHCTDVGNGQRFAEAYRGLTRYCHAHGRWYIWDGRCWAVDATDVITSLAKGVAVDIYAEARGADSDGRRKELAKWAIGSESVQRLKGMIWAATTEPGMRVMPDELDADPWKLNVLNGTIDLHTGELYAHRASDLITMLAPIEYGELAECPRWEDFLDRIFERDADTIEFVQKAVGYSLTGCTHEQVLFVPWGTGANGKSTFIRTIQNVERLSF